MAPWLEGVSSIEIQHQDRHQEQDAAGKGIQEEFDRGIDPVRSSPDSDQQIHRNQHRLPEDVEENEIQRDEDTQHGGFHDQQHGHETAHPGGNGFPGDQDTKRHQRGGHDHQRKADAIEAQAVMDRRRGDPTGMFSELHLARLRIKEPPEWKGQKQIGERDPERDPASGRVLNEAEDARSCQRQEDQGGQPWESASLHHP